jgi:hypothetical protein
VGGFAESKLLLRRVRAAFERDGRRVVVPGRPGLAVLRGAALLGLRLGAADRFASRVARFSYGVRIGGRYNPADPDHVGRAMSTGKVKGVSVTHVLDVFSVIVRKGASVKVDEAQESISLQRLYDDQDEVSFEIFATPLSTAKWTTDAGMTRLGEVALSGAVDDALRVELYFGRTELQAVAVNGRTGARRRVAVDFNLRSL